MLRNVTLNDAYQTSETYGRSRRTISTLHVSVRCFYRTITVVVKHTPCNELITISVKRMGMAALTVTHSV